MLSIPGRSFKPLKKCSGLEYPNNILAFKIISCSNLSAHAQSQVIAALQKEYRDNCNILHLTMHLLNKETALAQEYNSDPLEVTLTQKIYLNNFFAKIHLNFFFIFLKIS